MAHFAHVIERLEEQVAELTRALQDSNNLVTRLQNDVQSLDRDLAEANKQLDDAKAMLLGIPLNYGSLMAEHARQSPY